MEEQTASELPGNVDEQKPPSAAPISKTEIVLKRDWKEYIGESLLIIFSVVLALILTEFVNNAN